MKKIKIKSTVLLAACACGLAVSASAQSAPGSYGMPPNPAAAGSSYGLIGDTYSEVDLGYLKQAGAPKVSHDYDFTYNEAVLKSAGWGLDTNLAYDYLSGSASGLHDYRNELQAGATAYLWQGWGKPFVTADAGQAWDRVAGVDGKSFVYTFTGGVEFQTTRDLVLTPFVEYQAAPWLDNRAPAVANFPSHAWDYGVKASYRFAPQWAVSLAADMDQYNRNDLGYRAGLSYHF
jgi:hypothetical protein